MTCFAFDSFLGVFKGFHIALRFLGRLKGKGARLAEDRWQSGHFPRDVEPLNRERTTNI